MADKVLALRKKNSLSRVHPKPHLKGLRLDSQKLQLRERFPLAIGPGSSQSESEARLPVTSPGRGQEAVTKATGEHWR